MALTIELLGSPAVTVDGQPSVPPRGRKAWALLAYLLLTSRPPSRERMASLLFDEAADPLATLRWNLAQLRRSLGERVEIGGEPLTVRLPPDAFVDTEVLARGDWTAAIEVTGLGRELLEGIDLARNAAMETWLLAERSRFAGISASVLREAAIAKLAAGEPSAAVELASRLVAIEDFDEEAHALLVRAYVASGDLERARRQSATSARHLRDQLGVEPSATLARALDSTASPQAPGKTGSGAPGERAIEALIDAGLTAFNAGAHEAGIQTLQRASQDAEAIEDLRLLARAQVALGVALVHTARGRDGEGATALHTALASAMAAEDDASASEASRELGYVEFLRGRYDRAETWLERSLELAPDDVARASTLGVAGAVGTDRGQTGAAIASLEQAAQLSRQTGKPRIEGWAETHLGRVRLLRGELETAVGHLDRALAICDELGWMSYLAFPQALRADALRLTGSGDEAGTDFEAAFALGCQIGDPCWECLGARGIGLTHLDAGRVEEGFAWLEDAAVRSVRMADAYLWIEAYCLDTLCEQGIRHGNDGTAGWAERLTALAARTDMREMLVRSQLHRAALRIEGAGEAAVVLGRDIDNPVVLERLAEGAVAGAG